MFCQDTLTLGAFFVHFWFDWNSPDQFSRRLTIIIQRFQTDSPNQSEPWHDKTNKMSVRPAKTQISLGIRPVWSVFTVRSNWVAKDQNFLHVDSVDFDQTGRMPRLIWVFAGCTLILLVLSWRGSVWSLPLSLHSLDAFSNSMVKPYCSNFRIITAIFSCPNFSDFYRIYFPKRKEAHL